MVYVRQATVGMAFDVNEPMNAQQCNNFKAAGYVAALRYVPRKSSLVAGNITASEMGTILGAGLSLMLVQHVSAPGWEPSAELGELYGAYCANYAQAIGYPSGASIFCDLEEVSASCSAQDVIDYCTAWFKAVEALNYRSGLYVGWNIKLSDQQIYDLPVKSYWRAYNCDQSIPTRGYQIIQHTQKTLNGIAFDPNTIQKDELGDLPYWVSPI